MSRHLILALLLALAAGCAKDKPTTCDRYADMEVKCNGGEGVRSVAHNFCESSMKDRETELMAAMIALEAECAQVETDCDAYKACIEKKKKETDPPGF